MEEEENNQNPTLSMMGRCGAEDYWNDKI